MTTAAAHTPTRFAQHDARTLAIDWADGARSLLDVRALRLACACAECVDEWSGEVRLAPARVPMDVAPLGIHPVGRYAIQIDWSDGHSTGIYTFERLRSLASFDAGAPGEESAPVEERATRAEAATDSAPNAARGVR